jgi:hypothetical protein
MGSIEGIHSAALLLYLFWQLATLTTAATVARRLTKDAGDFTQFAALLLGLHIVLTSSLSLLLTVIRQNTVAAYVILSIILLAVALPSVPNWLRNAVRLRSQVHVLTLLVPLSAGLLLLPALVFNVAPITELDSLHSASSLLLWQQNSAPPYILAAGSGAFWEFSYLPGLVLTHSDAFYWLTSLEPVLLFALAAFLVARMLGLPRTLAQLAAANGTAIYHFWYGPIGVMTLKVDMAFAAGILLLVVSCGRTLAKAFNSVTLAFLAIGTSLSLAKNNGPFLALIIFSITGLFLLLARIRPPRRFLNSAVVLATATLLLPGHYYVHNLLLHGNPVYPVRLRLLGLELPGTIGDYFGTSIMSRLGGWQGWQVLLTRAAQIHYGGVLFPLTVLGILLAGSACFLWCGYLAFRRRPVPVVLGFSAFVSIAGWLFYFQSPWSAGAGPYDYGYLRPLASVRYVLPFLLLSEAVLAALLSKVRLGLVAAYVGVLCSFCSRLYVLYFQLPPVSSLSMAGLLWSPNRKMMLGVTTVGVVIVIVTLIFRDRRLWYAIYSIAAVAFVLGAPLIVEKNRGSWVPLWRPVVECLSHERQSRVFHVTYWPGHQVYAHRYVSAGLRAQHSVAFGPLSELNQQLRAGMAPPRYVAITATSPVDASDISRLEADLTPFGYAAVGSNAWCVLFTHAPAARLATVGRAQKPVATYGDSSCLCSCRSIKEHLSSVASTGELIYTTSPDRLYFREGRELRTVVGEEGATVEVSNLGGSIDQSLTGMMLNWHGGSWTLNNVFNESIKSKFEVASLRIRDVGRSLWSISGNVKWQLTPIIDQTGEHIRIQVLEDHGRYGWVALVYSLRQTSRTGGPLSFSCRIRSFGAPANLHYYDFGAKGVLSTRSRMIPPGSWHKATMSHRFEQSPERDYFAIGIFDVKVGSYIDISSARLYRAVLPEELADSDLDSSAAEVTPVFESSGN